MEELSRVLKELESKLEVAKESEKRQQEFEKKSAIRFKKNIKAIEKFFPKLHREIRSFTPRESFKVFATKSGVGNFVPEGSDVPIYSENPLEQSKRQVEEAVSNPVLGMLPAMSPTEENAQRDERLHVRYMRKLASTLHSQNIYNQEKISSLPSHFPTCMMFGLGLGYALSELVDVHSFDYLFICEPDFETFYASLFCIDWDKLLDNTDKANSSVFLHVGVSYKTFFEEIQQVCIDVGAFSLSSSFCFQHLPTVEVNLLIKEFFNKFHQVHLGYGFYNDAVTGIAHTIENFNSNNCPVFVPPSKNQKKYKNYTAYVVANGPSFDEAIDLLKSNQDNVIIFAAGTALPTLLNLNIKPDFHVLVERTKSTFDILVDTVSKDDLAGINLLAVDVMYPGVPPLYKWAGLGLKGPEAGTAISQIQYLKSNGKSLPSLICAGPLVANTALAYATMMGFEEIYLIGVDNGFPLDGKSHSSHSIYTDAKFEGKFKPSKDAPYTLKGNLGGQVKANHLMVQAKQQMEAVIKRYTDSSYYNVGNGAIIDGASPLEADDVICLPLKRDKRQIVEEIKRSFFDELSFDQPEMTIAQTELESLCDYLVDISKRPFSTRKEASDILKAQSRLIFAYRKTIHGHLFHVIKGTALYIHCPLISLLYQYKDEEKTIDAFKAGLSVWRECIRAIKKDYATAWNRRCNLSAKYS